MITLDRAKEILNENITHRGNLGGSKEYTDIRWNIGDDEIYFHSHENSAIFTIDELEAIVTYVRSMNSNQRTQPQE